MSELEVTTLSEDELKFIELYRQLTPEEKKISNTILTQMLTGNIEFKTDNQSYSITVKDNAALQIGNHNKQYHNVNMRSE